MSDDSPGPRGALGSIPDSRRGALLLTGAEFSAHTRQSQTLFSHAGEPALLAHVDDHGRLLHTRVWRHRGRLGLGALRPRERRFRQTLERLRRLDVPAPIYRAHGRVADSHLRFVVYEPLAGEPLCGPDGAMPVKKLAAFLADLHVRGVCFPTLTPASVVMLPDGRLGLADVTGVGFAPRLLAPRRRERDLARLCCQGGEPLGRARGLWSEAVMAYCRAANSTLAQAARLRDRVQVEMQRAGPVTDKMGARRYS